MWVAVAILALTLLAVCVRRKAWLMSPVVSVSVLYLFWLVPQYQSLSRLGNFVRTGYLGYGVMAALCLAALFAGFLLSRPAAARLPKLVNDSRQWKGVEVAAIVATFVSILLAILLESVRAEVAHMTQWSGRATIIYFFASLRIMPFALSAILLLRRRTPFRWALFLINLAIVSQIAFIYLRRSEVIDVVVILFGSYWFVRNRMPRLIYTVPAFVFVLFVVYAIGDLRRNANQLEFGAANASMFSPDVWRGVGVESTLAEASVAPDVLNGIYMIDYVSGPGDYALGAVTWDRIILQWVPATYLGADFKNSLMFGSQSINAKMTGYKGYGFRLGTTPTGIGSAFADFSYLGALYFMVAALLVSWLYKKALSGDIWDQVLYLNLLPLLLISFTHTHPLLLVQFPLFFGFWLGLKYISRFRYVRG